MGILSSLWQPDVLGLLILLLCVVLFVTKALPAAVVGCMGCLLMVLCRAASFEEAFSGFSSDIVLLMASSMIVGIAMFHTGAAQILGRSIILRSGGNERHFIFVGCMAAGILASFLANTAVLAAFLPIIDSVCKASHGMKQRNLVLPIAYAVMFGGACTLIGCTPQLTANALMSKMVDLEMGMWTMTAPGLCLFGIFIIYTMLFGYKDGEKIWKDREEADMGVAEEKRNSMLRTDFDRKKLILMFVIVALMTVSYIFSILPVAETAICAALLCVITGCCSMKDITKELSWDTIVFLATCLGLANALTAARSGELIGGMVTALIGDIQSPYLIFAIFILLTLFISQFVTNSTAIIITLPVALSICSVYGFNYMTFCIGITFAASLACCTPLAAAQITMTEVAGYEFSDYLKYGWKLTLIIYLAILVLVPAFTPF